MKEHIVVMLHPNCQYDSALVPDLIAPIQRGDVGVVRGPRFTRDVTSRLENSLTSDRQHLAGMPGRQDDGDSIYIFGL